MNYRVFIILCTVFVIFFQSNVNAADSFCSELKKIVSYANTGYQQLLGQPQGRSGKKYNATVVLPGASECYIMVEGGAYWCSWKVDRSSMSREFNTFASDASACYGKKPEIDANHKELSTFIELDSGVSIYIAEDYEGSVIDMSIEMNH